MTTYTNNHPKLEVKLDEYICYGDWNIFNANELENTFKQIPPCAGKKISINGKGITILDSAGALILLQAADEFKKNNNEVIFKNFNNQHSTLLKLIDANRVIKPFKIPIKIKNSILFIIGQETIQKLQQVEGLITLIGDLSEKLFSSIKNANFQTKSISANIYNTGITALPIIGLLSFLIGIVLAYQMGLQLQKYGGGSFIAYLSGIAILREFAPLITAIIVAGRTSSAFTAQIGIMKINEEVDALRTMGLSPTETLVLPKVLALLIIFPLLIFWAVIFGMIGAMVMSKIMLDVDYNEFLIRLQESLGVDQFLLGLYKAPAFALLIALVGCFQGFRVRKNANSLGLQTTKSVVQALFLIIIADAVYSIIYSWMEL